jgi:hypothetical protein
VRRRSELHFSSITYQVTFGDKIMSLLSTIKMTVVDVSSLLVVQKMLRFLQITSLLGDVM